MIRGRIPRVLLLVMAVLALTGVAAGSEILTLDDQTPLASDDSVAAFEQQGIVTADTAQVDMTVTVAREGSDAGLEGPRVDSKDTFVRINYREDITRTIRIYIPADMIEPRPKRGLQAENSGVSADLSPAGDGKYLALTFTVDGPTDATFAVSNTAGAIFSGRSGVREAVNNTTGFSMPSFGDGAEWQFVESSELNSTRSYRVDHPASDMTMQWDADPSAEKRWISVPECGDPTDVRVCYYRDGNATTIMTTTDNPPTVRYREGKSAIIDLKSAVSDLASVPDRVGSWVDGIFGGD